MKGKINKDGCLEIERAGKMKDQYCPFDSINDGDAYCGDWCPFFGEPTSLKYGDARWEISTCRNSLFFIELQDERTK